MGSEVVVQMVTLAEAKAKTAKASKADIFDIIVEYATRYCGAMPSTREIAMRLGNVTHTTVATRLREMIHDGTLVYLGGVHLAVAGAEWCFVPPQELK